MLFILLAGKQRRDVERLIADQRERRRDASTAIGVNTG